MGSVQVMVLVGRGTQDLDLVVPVHTGGTTHCPSHTHNQVGSRMRGSARPPHRWYGHHMLPKAQRRWYTQVQWGHWDQGHTGRSTHPPEDNGSQSRNTPPGMAHPAGRGSALRRWHRGAHKSLYMFLEGTGMAEEETETETETAPQVVMEMAEVGMAVVMLEVMGLAMG